MIFPFSFKREQSLQIFSQSSCFRTLQSTKEVKIHGTVPSYYNMLTI